MTQLIDKSALVAWAKESYLCENASMIRKVCYKQLVEYLDTLEVKEVDLEKEADECWNYVFELGWDENSRIAMKHDEFMAFAKHFFELGMAVSNKAQKGEEV